MSHHAFLDVHCCSVHLKCPAGWILCTLLRQNPTFRPVPGSSVQKNHSRSLFLCTLRMRADNCRPTPSLTYTADAYIRMSHQVFFDVRCSSVHLKCTTDTFFCTLLRPNPSFRPVPGSSVRKNLSRSLFLCTLLRRADNCRTTPSLMYTADACR